MASPKFQKREVIGRTAGDTAVTFLVDSSGRLYVVSGGTSVPEEKAYSFNTAELANIDIFGTDISPTNSPTTFRIYVWADAAGIFSCMRTSGGVTVTENLNEGNNLVANSAYEFNITLTDDDTINFQYSVAATMTVIVVEVYE